MNESQKIDSGVRQESFSPAKQLQDGHGQRFMQPAAQAQSLPQTPTRQVPAPQQDTHQIVPNGFKAQQNVQLPGSQLNPYLTPSHGTQMIPGLVVQSQGSNKVKAKKTKPEPPVERKTWLCSPHKLESYYVPGVHTLDRSINPESGHLVAQEDGLDIQAKEMDVEDKGTLKLGPRANYHGGLPISDFWFQDTLKVLLKFKHSMPQLDELGVIDIRALTLAIQSGIHGEVRLALDIIAALSHGNPPRLKECDDLLETLVYCANDQVETLVEHSPKTSDAFQIPSYQAQIRELKREDFTLQEVQNVESVDHELNRAADRLICITTILRNLSLVPESHEDLREPSILRMITNVIQYIGTRKLFLRTHRNTLDFSKDAVMFLSALSPSINLTSKDEALSILHFLLCFAPESPPIARQPGIAFAAYIPGMHRYFPHSIDSLTKLLARDPNRSLYRNLFASDNTSSPAYGLLTRAFGLAVGVIPDTIQDDDPGTIIAVRNATIAQGLLCAEILIDMIPTSEHQLAFTWLDSQDGFGSKLMTILLMIAKISMPEPQRHRDGRIRAEDEYLGFRMINARVLVVLRSLTEKAQDAGPFANKLPSGLFPQKQSVIQALGSNKDSEVVRHLCALSELAN